MSVWRVASLIEPPCGKIADTQQILLIRVSLKIGVVKTLADLRLGSLLPFLYPPNSVVLNLREQDLQTVNLPLIAAFFHR